MSLTLVGISHKTSSLEARERLALLEPGAVFERLRREGAAEAAVLSTCNRFELYLRGVSGPRALELLEEAAGVSLAGRAYVLSGAKAVGHLFEVASGLDSLVVGESEILGQVKGAYETARRAGMTGKLFNVLFQRALYTGKRARSATGIAVGQVSVASVAVQLAESIFGRLDQSEVLVLGAGAMAELTARHLLGRRVAKLMIANRTWERAQELAGLLGAEPLAWDQAPRALSRADIVVCSTSSPRPVVSREDVARAMGSRSGRSLFLIDIAMPRDVEEAVHGLDHVYLYRLEDLEGIVAQNMSSRRGEVERALGIARAKAEEFSRWERSLAEGAELSLRHSEPEAVGS